jgi:CRISPR-associated protein Csm3
MTRKVKLLGRALLHGEIEAKTGLRIGDTQNSLTIGGVDLPVIRNRRNNEPYIPGSSLKGKMRSLSEKLTNAPLNFPVNRGGPGGKGRVEIHTAQTEADYKAYWVNPIFGVTGDGGDWITAPNRLLVRDVPLTEKSRDELLNMKTDLPYTEVKWEAAIDRVTSAATPRQIERVPAGAVFGPMELVFNFYLPGDEMHFAHVLTALQLVEDDYLGGHGSRGSGKVKFRNLSVHIRRGDAYESVTDPRFSGMMLAQLIEKKADLIGWMKDTLTPA